MHKIYLYTFLILFILLLSGCGIDLHSLVVKEKIVIDKEHSLRVTATAYTSNVCQTDRTPYLAAWNNRLKPNVQSIAVSRDLLSMGLHNGTKVRIDGLKGSYIVLDKMNKRWKKKIDIYMGCDRRKAIHWGKRVVTIRWDKSDEEISQELIKQEEENTYNITNYVLKTWD